MDYNLFMLDGTNEASGCNYFQVGGSVRYELRDIEVWLESCPVGGGATE